jgi:hypothetical protein
MSRASVCVVASAVLAGAVVSAQAPAECASCVEARYWEISSTYWNETTPAETAPERARILIVDDEADFTELLRDHLGSSGYPVLTASNDDRHRRRSVSCAGSSRTGGWRGCAT